jgi:hypothetical protein
MFGLGGRDWGGGCPEGDGFGREKNVVGTDELIYLVTVGGVWV